METKQGESIEGIEVCPLSQNNSHLYTEIDSDGTVECKYCNLRNSNSE